MHLDNSWMQQGQAYSISSFSGLWEMCSLFLYMVQLPNELIPMPVDAK